METNVSPKESPLVKLESIPGGKYSFTSNADGTFNLLDVPIMSEIPAGKLGNEEDIDHEWMLQALAMAKMREAEGHWGSVHIQHHINGKGDENAGFLKLTRVGKVTYEGQQLSALFAHLLRVPKEVFESMKAALLPYRSIEGAKWDTHEVQSLALMSTQTPFFRLPMLTVGAEIPATDTVMLQVACAAAAVMCDATAYRGIKMADKPEEKKEGEEKAPEKKEGWLAKVKRYMSEMLADLETEATPAAPQEKKDEEKEKPKMADKSEDDEKHEKNKDAQPVEPRAAAVADVALSAENAALQSKIEALTSKDKERSKKESAKDLYEKAVASLKGYYLSADAKKFFLALASDSPEKMDEATKVFMTHAMKDPDMSEGQVSGAGASVIVSASDDPAVTAYAKDGPESLERARKFAVAHKEYAEKLRSDISLSDYLATNMNPKRFVSNLKF